MLSTRFPLLLLAIAPLIGCAGSAVERRNEAPADASEQAPAMPGRALGWLTLGLGADSPSALAAEQARQVLDRPPVQLVVESQLLGFLRERDVEAGLPREASRLLEQGKQAHLGMRFPKAASLYRKAAAKLEQGFARFYDPGLLADPILQLGVALSGLRDKEGARAAFHRAARLVPDLHLSEGYFSPSVRKEFDSARAELGAISVELPAASELVRLCDAAKLAGIFVAVEEQPGGRSVLRLALFDADKKDYAAVEAAVVSTDEATGEVLAGRLQRAMASLLGLAGALIEPPPPPGNGPVGPPPPWYKKHWWIWPVGAVVLGGAVTAIVLPLTVYREDVVDVRVRY